MKDIDLKQWLSEFNAQENSVAEPNQEIKFEDSPNRKSYKSEDTQNLNMPKKSTSSYSRTSKYQLEQIDEI